MQEQTTQVQMPSPRSILRLKVTQSGNVKWFEMTLCLYHSAYENSLYLEYIQDWTGRIVDYHVNFHTFIVMNYDLFLNLMGQWPPYVLSVWRDNYFSCP